MRCFLVLPAYVAICALGAVGCSSSADSGVPNNVDTQTAVGAGGTRTAIGMGGSGGGGTSSGGTGGGATGTGVTSGGGANQDASSESGQGDASTGGSGGSGAGAGGRADAGADERADAADGKTGPFKVFMIASTAPEHTPMSNAAIPVMQQLGMANDFTVDATSDTGLMTDENLARYQVFLQMQLGSFEMPPAAQAALQKFIEGGGGWVGVHAAGLTGIQFIEDKNGQIIGDLKYWPWYTTFIGGDANFVWSTHPALQQGTLDIVDRTHPATKNLPASFRLQDEWYEWTENPRPHVRVLGTADESTYKPVHPQGDHPIVWTNPLYPHTIYIGVGHDISSLSNTNYVALLRDSVLWAAGR